MRKARSWTLAFLIALAWLPTHAHAYSVLTHEELIDLAWSDSIRPLLLARFPHATDAQLIEAHAYAYGGSAIQDMGYYPFGRRFFSNLTHYARTGDFITWLFRHAQTLDEYAFAVGALSHYLGDTIGHSQAVNPATALGFSKLRQEFGNSVTYGESPHAHIRTEFAFDIDELTDLAFAPPAYLQRIGFKVPRKFLEQAFIGTYGFDIHQVLGRAHPALRSYRTSVRSLIPAFAEAEVVLHRHQFPAHPDDEAYRTFRERVASTNYDRHWRHTYKGPGIRAHLLAVLVFLVPKIGGASDLAIKIPTPKTEDWYLQSVNHTLDVFRETLHTHLSTADSSPLANLDLDTGNAAKFGDYPLADQTYAQLVLRLASNPDRTIPADLKQNIVDYYAGLESLAEANGQLRQQLETVKAMKPVPDPR